ncbi:hypothetical protein BC830DRAFT_1146888 [Chytriomyces sp. MP71]|nr:hypothetical protein BC830DRAFT_1146888 [Chytriomyces sp. MP71]
MVKSSLSFAAAASTVLSVAGRAQGVSATTTTTTVESTATIVASSFATSIVSPFFLHDTSHTCILFVETHSV